MRQGISKTDERPSEWIEKHFYVNDPRDPITGEFLPPGPIVLAAHQRRIVDEALATDENGNLKYATVVYSAPKKSGKSALTSAVITYVAFHNPNSFLACVANDGKQANDRLYGPIKTCLINHNKYSGALKGEHPNLGSVVLKNNTKIEAIPCDAAGEAGSQPLFVAWSELWGFETPNKRKMFTELTIPPTLYGRAMRWIESYAGYTGVSELLEQIYTTGFINGNPHPDFTDLQGRDGPVVRINPSAKMFVYWDSEHRMPWQTGEYYEQESAMLPPAEYSRIHFNQWVSSLNAFVQEEWWDACENSDLPPLTSNSVPVVVGIDMAVTGDCAALVAVTRDPYNPETNVAVRAVRIFNPKELGGIIDQELHIRPVIEQWAEQWNVVCWVYDPREMSKLAQDLTRDGIGWFKPFGQTSPRAVADKALYDMIISKQVSWSSKTTSGDVGCKTEPGDTLYKHITLAGADVKGDTLRLQKLSNNAKIDSAVALSQAASIAMQLVLDNTELDYGSIIELYRRREITHEEFTNRVRLAHPELDHRIKHGRSRR